MALCTELKSDRTSAKRAVTIASTRLSRATERKIAYSLHNTLEEKYCEFLVVTGEYREACGALADEGAKATFTVVGGKDLDAYDAEVKAVYTNATATYRQAYPSTDSGEASSTAAAAATPATQRNTPEADFRLKKRDVPKFSGALKDWPKFKSVWLKVVVPSITNEIVLASELKLACKDSSSAYKEIVNL